MTGRWVSKERKGRPGWGTSERLGTNRPGAVKRVLRGCEQLNDTEESKNEEHVTCDEHK